MDNAGVFFPPLVIYLMTSLLDLRDTGLSPGATNQYAVPGKHTLFMSLKRLVESNPARTLENYQRNLKIFFLKSFSLRKLYNKISTEIISSQLKDILAFTKYHLLHEFQHRVYYSKAYFNLTYKY